ncbi:MAG: hypothetical protein ACE3L7_04020 [Candidatus Pristimantibacillus sp.]
MLQNALQKLSTEVGSADKKNKFVPVVGGFLINHVRENPEHAALIMADGKSIAGSLEAMKNEAKKQAVNGFGMLTDEEGFNVVLQYYGIDVPETPKMENIPPAVNFNIALEDLL